VCLVEFDEAEEELGKKRDSKGVGARVVSFVVDDLGIWIVMLNRASGIEAGQVCVEVISILPCQSAMLRYVRSSQDLVHFAGSARQRMHAHQMWGLVLQVTTSKSDDPLNGCSSMALFSHLKLCRCLSLLSLIQEPTGASNDIIHPISS
jgi:hypothetical protein